MSCAVPGSEKWKRDTWDDMKRLMGRFDQAHTIREELQNEPVNALFRESSDQHGNNIFHVAALRGEPRYMLALLELFPPDVATNMLNTRTYHGYTVLELAILTGCGDSESRAIVTKHGGPASPTCNLCTVSLLLNDGTGLVRGASMRSGFAQMCGAPEYILVALDGHDTFPAAELLDPCGRAVYCGVGEDDGAPDDAGVMITIGEPIAAACSEGELAARALRVYHTGDKITPLASAVLKLLVRPFPGECEKQLQYIADSDELQRYYDVRDKYGNTPLDMLVFRCKPEYPAILQAIELLVCKTNAGFVPGYDGVLPLTNLDARCLLAPEMRASVRKFEKDKRDLDAANKASGADRLHLVPDDIPDPADLVDAPLTHSGFDAGQRKASHPMSLGWMARLQLSVTHDNVNCATIPEGSVLDALMIPTGPAEPTEREMMACYVWLYQRGAKMTADSYGRSSMDYAGVNWRNLYRALEEPWRHPRL